VIGNVEGGGQLEFSSCCFHGQGPLLEIGFDGCVATDGDEVDELLEAGRRVVAVALEDRANLVGDDVDLERCPDYDADRGSDLDAGGLGSMAVIFTVGPASKRIQSSMSRAAASRTWRSTSAMAPAR
jgi:hypothetical protein